ncbi:hypothetical protein BZK31_24235 [Pseudomonas floridensis]|uniref:Uncharacterized protein n=1 Tax=Pseudomonas floridensis TaxID=1958950 RepID=A0A1X0MZR2_9PSED|nr:hypothetical protein [Pseudomonas floridensis]ORC55769.1 hypothetical protein BZK31_24235 [Pseudomonas floridensis]
MCGPKEPIAGVFVLLLLAAGSWAAQEPFPHFGSDITPEPQTSGAPARSAPVHQSTTQSQTRFSEIVFKPDDAYARGKTQWLLVKA